MPCITDCTSAWVASAPPLAKLMVRVPPVFVKVAKVCPPACRFAPLTVKPDALKLNRSLADASALPSVTRLTVKVAPFQLVASFSVSVTERAVPPSSATVLPTPAQATLSPDRAVMTGGALAPATVMPLPVRSATVTAASAPVAQSSAAARL